MTRIDFANGKSADIPSSWEEMTPEQIRSIFRLHDECVRKGRSPLEFNIRVLLFVFLGLRPSRKLARLAPEISEKVYLICEECLGFLFAAPKDTLGVLELAYRGIANPIPVIRRPLRHPLKGPMTLLQDLSFGRFRNASRALQEFFKTKDIDALDECIAWLYDDGRAHPVREGRDPRTVAGIKSWQKNLIMSWFACCLNYLQTQTITIDGEDVDMKLLFSGSGNDAPAERFTWKDLVVQISRDGSIGNMDAVDEEPLFSILSILWCNYKENKRDEKIRKASKTK